MLLYLDGRFVLLNSVLCVISFLEFKLSYWEKKLSLYIYIECLISKVICIAQGDQILSNLYQSFCFFQNMIIYIGKISQESKIRHKSLKWK